MHAMGRAHRVHPGLVAALRTGCDWGRPTVGETAGSNLGKGPPEQRVKTGGRWSGLDSLPESVKVAADAPQPSHLLTTC